MKFKTDSRAKLTACMMGKCKKKDKDCGGGRGGRLGREGRVPIYIIVQKTILPTCTFYNHSANTNDDSICYKYSNYSHKTQVYQLFLV